MEAQKNILKNCLSTLQTHRHETEKMLRDPKIVAWGKINLKKYTPIMEAFHQPPNLQQARNEYGNVAKQLLKGLEKIENEVGNLQAEIDTKSATPPEKTAAAVTELEKKCAALQQPAATLQSYNMILLEADKGLRENLTLKNLLTLSEEMIASEKKAAFYQGCTILNLITTGETDKTKTLEDYHAEAASLAARLERIDLSELPGMASAAIKHYIDIAEEATDNLVSFFEFTGKRAGPIFDDLNKTKVQLQSIKEKPLNEALPAIIDASAGFAEQVAGIARNAILLTELKNMANALQDITCFYISAKHDLKNDLLNQTRNSNSALNPVELGQEMAKTYFSGLLGIKRMLKYLFYSLFGHKLIGEKELLEILEDAMGSCTVLYNDNEDNKKEIKDFIKDFLGIYHKPFPFNDLFQLLEITTTIYSARLKKHIDNFKIDITEISADNIHNIDTGKTHKVAIKDIFARLEEAMDTLEETFI